MNQNQIQQLTLHLSQALDQNYDVVNMETVLSVICALEGTTITKEQLEATRLAKYINQLRRRTKNESLARRAKSLLKKWREMVGIQQTINDSQPLQPQLQSQSFKNIPNVVNSISSESVVTETVDRLPAMISSVSDSSEMTNFSNLIRHINIENSNDSIASKAIRNQQTVGNKPEPFINEHSTNSICSLEKLNEPSIVIDIVTDSDENNEQPERFNTAAPSSSLSFPTLFTKNQKKIKKDKKHREREARVKPSCFLQQQQQSSRINGFTDGKVPTDSEILSLSNSSMSSILSIEVISGNSQSQSKFRATNTTPDLTFAGRFKSVVNRLDNSVLPNDQKETANLDTKCNDEIVNNDDSSTSCSRLSVFEDFDTKEQQQVISTLKPYYKKAFEGEQPMAQVPKKRGRKKGSKGVDSIIAKKESSLSQQIFFGSAAGVKKVKTTKELFNEIQSRKLSISLNRCETSPGVNKSTSHNVQTRPASSCSETSINSPHTLDAKSTLDDVINTDSETLSSERQTSPSFDSNSNYSILQNASIRKIDVSTAPLNHDVDSVKTQLMHLVHSLSSPLSVTDTEKLYEALLVPCTCHIVEEILKEQEPDEGSNAANQKTKTNIVKIAGNLSQVHSQQTKIENSNDNKNLSEEITTSKPIKSIFDLDFDDADDPLSAIVKDVKMPENSSNSKICFDNVKSNSAYDTSTESNSCLDIQYKEENDVSDINIAVTYPSLFTLHEDPNCPAKQRFNVQTMDVTGFHINALHNYYIPNINGNWNNIDILSEPYPTISELLSTLETYTISDGADVVPKFGSLTFGRIRKDLSTLKFAKSCRPKIVKSSMAPFLGIAKCLPSCRRAANRRCSKKITKLSEYTIIDKPLRVDVDISLDDLTKGQLQYGFDQETYNSGNLLRMSGESIETPQTMNRYKERKNSSNSCLSQKGTPSSIIEMVRSRKTHTQRTLVERNRKKRRKEQNIEQETRIKRIKIALNGNASTQRRTLHSNEEESGQICKDVKYIDNNTKDNEYSAGMQTELSDTENESSRNTEHSNECGTDVEEEEYAIVQRPLMSGNFNNHIVLTIKKTPSKINSPRNRDVESIINPIKDKHSRTIYQNNTPCGQQNEYIMGVTNEACTNNSHKYSRYCCRRIGHNYRFRHRKFSSQHKTIDLELKHIFSNNNLNQRPILKAHQKLFFANELDREDNSGQKERIINYSSSSDENESASECEFEFEKDLSWYTGQTDRSEHKIKIKVQAEATAKTEEEKQTVESYLSSSDASVNTLVSSDSENDAPQVNKIEDLRHINNGMLPSFNSILENCGDIKSSSYDHLNVIKSYSIDPCSSFEQNFEYRSGIRTVGHDEPIHSQIQQFREWHEILQLQSYNNEPLVVLPYVVLE